MADLRKSIASNAPEIQFRVGPATWYLVRLSPGEFLMGTPLNEPGRQDWEMPPRRVRLTRPFYLGKYEVTRAQYRAVMGTPAAPDGPDDLPVDDLAFAEVLEFCRRLSDVAGITVTLPTEAQWEYACRAGTTTPYYSGSTAGDLDRIAWYAANSPQGPHPVGEKQPNLWGLFDMLGNAAEPCIDYVSFDSLSSVDPEGTRSPQYGAKRGGAWMDSAANSRVGYRLRTRDRLAGLGIRIAVNP